MRPPARILRLLALLAVLALTIAFCAAPIVAENTICVYVYSTTGGLPTTAAIPRLSASSGARARTPISEIVYVTISEFSYVTTTEQAGGGRRTNWEERTVLGATTPDRARERGTGGAGESSRCWTRYVRSARCHLRHPHGAPVGATCRAEDRAGHRGGTAPLPNRPRVPGVDRRGGGRDARDMSRAPS